MINAGILIIDKHGKENVSLLFPIFENYLNKKASDEEKYDLVREGVVIFTGALAKHLAKDDPKVHVVVDKLLDVLNTPSEAVQRAVSMCLSPLMQSKQDDAAALVSRLLDQLMKSDKYGERHGAAFGLAGVVKGFEISCLKNYCIAAALREGRADRYVIHLLPLLLVSFSDQVIAVREAVECAACAMMSQLSAQGVKLVLPSLLKAFVEEVMELVELTPLGGAFIALPGVNGLSTEQRKRLTIAVELVANPSIVFINEPTSGLDARLQPL